MIFELNVTNRGEWCIVSRLMTDGIVSSLTTKLKSLITINTDVLAFSILQEVMFCSKLNYHKH